MGARKEAGPTHPSRGRHKDIPTPSGTQVEIGRSQYLLSEELQSYCFVHNTSAYEHTKSVLTFGEPHHATDAQFSLYKGLEIFFRDNPELVGKTIFLAEGFPADEPISVQQLIEADPHPSDDLIRETLNSFLITGYMAYEWKHQQGIPIIGTENQGLYEMSREFATWYVENPNALFTTAGIKITETRVRVVQIPVSAAWTFAVNVRNKSMAATLIDKARSYKNPVLFVGSGHLNTMQDDSEFDMLKKLTELGPNGPFGQYADAVSLSGCENHSIHYYLQQAKIGYTALEPFGFSKKREEMVYQRLFEAQRKGGVTLQTNIDYEAYLNWLIAQKRSKPGQITTVTPSPEAAAEFVRRLKEKQQEEQKSGVIYEAPSTSISEYWFRTSPEEERAKIREQFGVDSIWELPPVIRGKANEVLRGAEPASNLKHVDDIRYEAQTVTGMKTIELRDKTYQDIDNLDSRIRDCIDELSGYQGGVWKKRTFTRGDDFDDVYLEIAIPADKATRVQVEKILEMQDYAQTKDVTLVINEVP